MMNKIFREFAPALSVFFIAAMLLASPASAGGKEDHRHRPEKKEKHRKHGKWVKTDEKGRDFAVGELLVKYRKGVPEARKKQKRAKRKSKKEKEFRSIGVEKIRLEPGMTVEEAMKLYADDPDVEYVEPNFVGEPHAVPNDPRYAEQWALSLMDAAAAWDIGTGSSEVVVALNGGGVDLDHPDLVGNLWTNPLESPGDANGDGCPGICDVDDDGDGLIDEDSAGNGRYLADGVTPNPDWRGDLAADDDENGYPDDIHGISMNPQENNVPMDEGGHGTNVAGVVGAVGNNGLGVSGINWNVKLLACKNGFSTSGLLACLEYIKTLKDGFGVNIVASNNSYEIAPSGAIRDAIRAQMESDILFVASAGNKGRSRDPYITHFPNGFVSAYPSANPNLISVAMTNPQWQKVSWSDYGRYSIDIGAPGEGVLTTSIGGGYGRAYGTSFAAPQVTGLAALIKSAEGEIAGSCSDASLGFRSDCEAAGDVWTPTPAHCLDPAQGDETGCRAAGSVWTAEGTLNVIDIRNRILAGGIPEPSLADTTVSGRRVDAFGAMSCTTDDVLRSKWVDPRAIVGDPTRLFVYSFDCRGSVDVTAVTEDGRRIDLRDDGVSPDEMAGDGIYSAWWTPERTSERITFSTAYRTVEENFRFVARAGISVDWERQSGGRSYQKAGSDGLGNIWTVEYRSDSASKRLAQYDPAGNELPALIEDPLLSDAVLLGDGGIFAVYRTESVNVTPRIDIVRYDASGNPVANASYENAGLPVGERFSAVDASGNLYLLATGAGPLDHEVDWHVLKYDASLNLLWSHVYTPRGKYPGDYCAPTGIAVDSQGNFYVAGYIYVGGGMNGLLYKDVTLKFDAASGGILWERSYFDPPTGTTWADGIAIDGDDNVYVVGHGQNGDCYGSDTFVLKYDPEGAVRWIGWLDMALGDWDNRIAVDADGLIYVAGRGGIAVNYDPSQGETWRQARTGLLEAALLLPGPDGELYLFSNNVGGVSWNAVITRFEHFRIPTWNIPGAPVGLPYSVAFSVTGGPTGTPAWAVSAGTMPPGLSLDPATGVISGTPTVTGLYPLTITASVGGRTTSRDFAIHVQEPLSITTASVPYGLRESAYSFRMEAAGGSGSYSWSVSAGVLPEGLVLDGTTGEIRGTPALEGDYTFSLRVADADVPAALPVERSFSMSVYGPVRITTTSLPPATADFPYAGVTLTATGGTGNYSWSWSGGIPGLVLDPISGTISGTPSYVSDPTLTISVHDGGAVVSSVFTLDLSLALSLTAPNVRSGAVGYAYSLPIDASGGAPPTACSIAAGTLPAGLSIDPVSCDVSGTPAAAGTYAFTVRLRDDNGAVKDLPLSVEILDNDLSVLAVSGTLAGYDVVVDYTVSHPMAYNFPLQVYLSPDAVITSSDHDLGQAYVYSSCSSPCSGRATFRISGRVPSGTYFVGAIADPQDRFAESDESNNALAGNTIRFTALPDLKVYSIDTNTGMLIGGQYGISFQVRNFSSVVDAPVSTASLYLSTDYQKSADDRWLGDFAVPAVPASQSVEIAGSLTIPPDTAPGDYRILILANADGSVQESSTSNNLSWAGVLVSTDPSDLVVTSISADVTEAEVGKRIFVSYTVLNQGAGKSGVARVGFYLSPDAEITTADTSLGGRNATELLPGESMSGTAYVYIPRDTPPGSYFLGALVDDGDRTPESDEGNNTLASPIRVFSIDLQVSMMNAVINGDLLLVDLEVRNAGSEPVGASNAGIFLTQEDYLNTGSALRVGDVATPALAAGEVFTASAVEIPVPADVAVGAYHAAAYADIDDEVAESWEYNNSLFGNAVEFYTVERPVNRTPEDREKVLTTTPTLTASPFSDPVRNGAHAASEWQIAEMPHFTPDGLMASVSGDDEYLRYRLPFTFPFFGRSITTITVSTNGMIQLLEEGEDCVDCDEWSVHADGVHVGAMDAIFASEDDLDTRDGHLKIYDREDHVLVEWYATTYRDQDIVNFPLRFQVEMYPDGSVRWNFEEMLFSGYSGDMFSGVYAREEDLEIPVGSLLSTQDSYAFDPVSQTVAREPFSRDVPESYFVYAPGVTETELTSWTVPPEAGLEDGNTYYWRVRYQSDLGDWSRWSLPTRFSVDTWQYPITQLSPAGLAFNYPDINDRGDVAWAERNTARNGYAVFLYESGSGDVLQIRDYLPDGISTVRLNNRQDVAWGGSSGVYLNTRADGVTTYIGSYGGFFLNDAGDLALISGSYPALHVFFRDGESGGIVRLTDVARLRSGYAMNNNGDVIWSEYGWIYLYRRADDEVLPYIPFDAGQYSFGPYAYPVLNDAGDVAYLNAYDESGGEGVWDVMLYDASDDATLLLGRQVHSGGLEDMNEAGDVVWVDSDGNDNEIFLYDAASGEVVQITDNDVNDYAPKINRSGDVAWQSFDGVRRMIRIALAADGRQLLLYSTQGFIYWPTVRLSDTGDVLWQENSTLYLATWRENTIFIKKAEYSEEKKELKVEALSDYGSSAALSVEGFGPMTWKADKDRWELKIKPVDRHDVPGDIVVSGPEGSAVKHVKIKKKKKK